MASSQSKTEFETVDSMATQMTSDSIAWLAGQRICLVGKSGGLVKKELRKFVKQSAALIVPDRDPEISLVVIGADSFPFDIDQLSDPLKERIHSGKAELIEETEFWEKCGQIEDPDNLSRLYTPAMLADLLGVQASQVRRWYRRGLICPVRKVHRLPYFDFQEIATARKIAGWLKHQSADQIEKKLTELAKLVPSAKRSLSQLSIIVEGKDVFLREIGGVVEPGGQRLFDFHYSDEDEEVVSEDEEVASTISVFQDEDSTHFTEFSIHSSDSVDLKIGNHSSHARNPEAIDDPSIGLDQLLFDALDYEGNGQWDEALAIYRSMILSSGLTADLSFQIAELLYRKGDLSGARERYFVAIELDDHFVEARANLGCVLCELQQWETAVSVFQGALSLHPNYADVLFHLASCLDKLDRREDADQYWKRFVEQAPTSPWAAYAKARLNSSSKDEK